MIKILLKNYTKPFLISILFFFFFSFYLYLRRGYFDLYIANKVFGSIPVVTIGLILIIGPFSRAYQRFDTWVHMRKELGIIAMISALLHGIISLFLLPERFNPAYFFTRSQSLPFLLGVISLLILIYLFILSLNAIVMRLDKKQWWHIQNWGIRIAIITILLHVFLMKWTGWVKWFTEGGSLELARPYMPPGSLIAGSIGVYVVIIRLAEYAGQKTLKLVIPLTTIFYVIFLLVSFYWGYQKSL